MVTRPSGRTWTVNSKLSSSDMPMSGTISTASIATWAGWPSHSNDALVDVEHAFGPVSQQCPTSPSPGELQLGDQGRGQTQRAVKASINDGFNDFFVTEGTADR